ncbi:MAG: TadE/TadG family type IV pilus assembly protein [Terriglobales bacterium]
MTASLPTRALAPAPPARRRRRMAGQALVETALMLPLLLLLMTGVEELGRAAYTAIVATDAAYAGALYGAQSYATAADNAGMVAAAVADGGEVSSLTATAAHVCTCASGGSAPNCALTDCTGSRLLVYAQVNTTAIFTPVCSLLGWPGSITLNSQAYVRAKP